ncbi:MAG: VOC family protein [Bacteroidota bacterium]
MKLTKAAPVLASLDILKSLDFYEQKLGFRRTYGDEGYGVIVRDDIVIHFWKCEDKIFPENTSCYVYVEDVDQLYQACKAAAIIHPNGDLKNHPHGMREFAILDLFGNLIRFGQAIEA